MTKTWSGGERPRERLEHMGADALADHELVALVLGLGVRSKHVSDLAHDVLQRAGGVAGMARLSRDELLRVMGIGRARSAQLLAAVELGRRSLAPPSADRPTIRSARAAAEILIPRFGSRTVELFGALLLDRGRRLMRVDISSQGSVDAAVAHPREVFRAAVGGGASAVIVFHNHPSGDPSPSAEDVALTKRLLVAGDVVGIPVLDHVIVGGAAYFSFQEARLLRAESAGSRVGGEGEAPGRGHAGIGRRRR